jgi:UDP-glucose 4-epimerase
MSILVTGGVGFIGSAVANELEARGRDPVIYDRRSTYDGRSGPPQFPAILGDVTHYVETASAIHGREGVIHLAGILGTQETIRDPEVAATVNIGGTLNVLRACRTYDVPLVVISVGNWWMTNTYSISKYCAERFAMMFRQELNVPVCVVRALNAYGPGQKALPVRKIIPTFINAALANEPIEIYGDGKQIMDMIHVQDVARVLIDSLDAMPDTIVEAGTGRPTTVNQIAHAVRSAVYPEAAVLDADIVHIPMRPGETPGSTVLADTKTLAAVGWHPKAMIPLEQGLADTVPYYRAAMASA